MDDPLPHEQYISRSDHSVADDLRNLMLQETPSVDFQSVQIAPIVYENAFKKKYSEEIFILLFFNFLRTLIIVIQHTCQVCH